MSTAAQKAKKHKKEKMIKNAYAKRTALKEIISAPKTPDKERMDAVFKLTKMPKNTSKIRHRNRCAITGRARGFLRRFGISRLCFRELALKGEIPGITKASW